MRVAGHALQREGAAYDHNGRLLDSGGYIVRSGPGRAKCECGALSEVLPSTGARQRWHSSHKEAVAAEAKS